MWRAHLKPSKAEQLFCEVMDEMEALGQATRNYRQCFVDTLWFYDIYVIDDKCVAIHRFKALRFLDNKILVSSTNKSGAMATSHGHHVVTKYIQISPNTTAKQEHKNES